MEYRYLGKTGLRVSEISFGPGNNDIEEDGEAVRTLESAFDLGVTLYDTSSAEKGGRVEEWLGRAFKNKRQDVVLATKFKGGATRKHIILECEKSLKRMNSDYIDIYQFFRWDSTVAIEESLEALTNLVRQGKILYAGCCSFKTYQMANALRASERHGFTELVSLGAKYNLLGQDPFSSYPMAEVQELDLIPFCEEMNIGLMPFRPLAGGLLTGKYAAGESAPSGSRFADTKYSYPNFVEGAKPLLEVVDQLKPLAERRGESMAQFGIAWILSKPAVSSVLVGANTVEQLEQCVSASGHALSEEELREVDEIRSVLPGVVVG